jgi:anti-sigma regulatory factor (Ser/Thr protein kinase)
MRSRQNQNKAGTEIRLTVLGILEHRDIVLRAVSSVCKLVTGPHGRDWQDFQAQVVSAVSEAFNNLVLHGYQGRKDGRVDLIMRPGEGEIQIVLRDWGKGFDPKSVPVPELEALPESGMGLYIMQSFMVMKYRRGRPNLLTLSKKLQPSATASTSTSM